MGLLHPLFVAPAIASSVAAALTGGMGLISVLVLQQCDDKFGCWGWVQIAVVVAAFIGLLAGIMVACFQLAFTSGLVAHALPRGVAYCIAGVLGACIGLWLTWPR